MRERRETRDRRENRPILLHGPVMRSIVAGYVILALGCTLGLYGAYNANQNAKDAARSAKATALRNSRLAQQLCKAFSTSRVQSNSQVRVPLRLVLNAQADVLTAAAMDYGNGASQRRLYLSKARSLRKAAKKIPRSRSVPCEFR